MSFGMLRFATYMIPILWSFLKDMIWEELSLGEIRTNYLFGKANAYERAVLIELLDIVAKNPLLEFKHFEYPQLKGDFIPYLSVIDLLFNVGSEAENYFK